MKWVKKMIYHTCPRLFLSMALNLSFFPDLFSTHFPFLPSLHSKYIQLSLYTSLILRKNLLKLRKHLNVTFPNLSYNSILFLIGT